MKYARVENNTAIEVIDFNPVGAFHPSLIWTEVPDHVLENATKSGNTWTNPVVPAPTPVPTPEPLAKTVSPVEFKLLLAPAERIAIRAARATDPVIDDMFDILEDPRLTGVNLGLISTASMIDYLISQGHIEASRKAVILSGDFQ